MSDQKYSYENLVPRSSIDAVRVGVDETNKKIVLEFGFQKNEHVINIDVCKELTEKMVQDLINNLQSCLEDLQKL